MKALDEDWLWSNDQRAREEIKTAKIIDLQSLPSHEHRFSNGQRDCPYFNETMKEIDELIMPFKA